MILFLLPWLSLFAEQKILSIPGKGGIPYFDSLGNLNVVYTDVYGRMSLTTIQEGKGYTDEISTQNLTYRDNVQFICVKEDRIGRKWLLWEERYPAENDVYITQLNNRNLLQPINLSTGQKGHNFSLNIDFSLDNELWAAWINYSQKKYTIFVKNVTADLTWTINSPLGHSALTPNIIIDGTGKIWLFWDGKLRNHDEILYTHFDGQKWLEPLSLNMDPDVPHITPSISLDINGFPHVAWGAYDGDDYEIYYSCWDGYKWSQETKITDHQNISDTSPSISLFLDRIPIVAWLRSSNGTREICFSYKRKKEWSPEIRISAGIDITEPPQLISSGKKIGILWQDQAGIKICLRHLFEWRETSYSTYRNVESPRVLSLNFARILDLDRDKYIGFGDSITHGTIANAEVPHLGYVPRLESLIDANIKDSEVVNEGIGGEKTAEGLARINTVINNEQAQTIFLMEGTNDVKDPDISIDTAAFNLSKMTERCLDLGMIPFLATITPYHPWNLLTQARVRELNQKIESEAADPNIYLVDQFSSFMNHPNTWPALLSDNTHPNETGYQLMAEFWYDALADTLARIEIDETSLSFEADLGDSNPPDQTFKIRNSGLGKLDYQISVDQLWLNVSPSSNDSTGSWDEIQVSVDISNLAPGTYQGAIEVSAEITTNNPQVLAVQLTILDPTIGVDKTSLSFEAGRGESNPPAQTLNIRNSGSGRLDYQISVDQQWLSLSPSSGDSTGEWDEIQVSVDISNLTQGTYQGRITISPDNAAAGSRVVTVQLTIFGPTIEVDKTSISFEGTEGEANPVPQTFKIRNSGAGTLHYQISVGEEWLSVSPLSGDSSGEWDEILVSVDISNLTGGTYQGSITTTAENASNTPQALTISLTVHLPPLFSPLNFHGEKKENKSVSLREYINILEWQVNFKNKFVEKYKIYLIEGDDKILAIEVDAQTFEYWHRRVEKNKVYRYGLTAVDKYGRESEVVTIELR